jgi:hypothetical protein
MNFHVKIQDYQTRICFSVPAPDNKKPAARSGHRLGCGLVYKVDFQGDRRDLNPRHPDPQSEHNATQNKQHKAVTPSAGSGCSAGCSGQRSEGGILDADLAALIAAWPTLPDPIRAAIRALVGTVAPTPTPFAGPSGGGRIPDTGGNSRDT